MNPTPFSREPLRGLALLAAAFASLALAIPASAASLDGIWQNRNGTVEVKVAPCGRAYCGTVIAARGSAIGDARAGGVGRLVGTRVMDGYTPAGGGTWRGSVFVPQLGGHLSSNLRFVDSNTVEVSGCVLAGLVCKTKVWHRIGSPSEGAALARGR